MHRMIRALATLAIVLGCASAHALDAAKVAAVGKAADAFVALAGDSAKTGRVPRHADPAIKPLLDTVFDTSELQNGPAQPMSMLGEVNAWNLAVLKVGMIYVLAGTGVSDITALANTPAVTAKITGNAVDFAPEVGRYMDAQLWLQAAIADTVTAFVSTASPADLDRPNVKSGLPRIRSGVASAINGFITTLPTEGLTDAWRAERMPVLLAIGPKAARLVLAEDLAALRAAATEVADQMKDAKVKAACTAFAATLAPQ
jgi:hypothetical protein